VARLDQPNGLISPPNADGTRGAAFCSVHASGRVERFTASYHGHHFRMQVRAEPRTSVTAAQTHAERVGGGDPPRSKPQRDPARQRAHTNTVSTMDLATQKATTRWNT